MIISHRHRFIFLKTNKTAGTSVEIALSKFCGPDDVITPISADDEEIRKELGYRGPQNFSISLSRMGFLDVAKWLSGRGRKKFYNHITAKEVKESISTGVWDNYYKFCIERNPWDRVVSLYYHRHKQEPRPTFSEFVCSDEPLILRDRGYKLYTISGDVVVDKICKFENLSEELESVRQSLGIPEQLDLPRAKSKYRKDKGSYQDAFESADRDKIAELFRDEIDLCKYEF